jgi:glycosyltransferase involved in cell wall biosynthesis
MRAISEVQHQRSEIGFLPSAVDAASPSPSSAISSATADVAILTGGGDKPYALGLAAALTEKEVSLDFIGSDDLKVPQLLNNARVNFLNLRGDQRSEANLVSKMARVLAYYWRLVRYAATAKPRVFHILWNNKLEFFDRTVLMLYYKLLGKKLLLTAHNVNTRNRDSNDTWLNRVSLKIQYKLSNHIFVHTDKMKIQLASEFGIPKARVTVVPFGINNTVPDTRLTTIEAKRLLGLSENDKILLFFGNIAPYKGLEYLVAAFGELLKKDKSYRLLMVGRPKGAERYWIQIRRAINDRRIHDRIIERSEYIPDEEAELYFKAADVLVLPYTRVFQSGVLFLGYSFGLPVIASDVGSLKEEIVENKTGFVFKPEDLSDLAGKIEHYFNSDLFQNLESHRAKIKAYANERYSWSKVAGITTEIYSELLGSSKFGGRTTDT